MFDRVHAGTSEGFWVSVAVVKGVDVVVKGTEMNEAVDKVEVEILDDEADGEADDEFDHVEEVNLNRAISRVVNGFCKGAATVEGRKS